MPKTSRPQFIENEPLGTQPRGRYLVPSGIITLLCVALMLWPGRPGDAPTASSELTTARVTAVDNNDLGQYGRVQQGTQRLTLELLGSPHQGTRVEAVNLVKGDLEFDHVFTDGQRALVTLNLASDGTIDWIHVHGPYRLGMLALLAGVFVLLLVAVCGWTGVRAALSFAFAGLVIWRVMVPLFLTKIDPVPVALGIVALLCACIMLLVGGPNRRGLVALLGSIAGLGVTCLLSVTVSSAFHINGAVRPFAKNLLMRQPDFDITRLFLAGIIVGACGAVMDLAMDVASALQEIHLRRPDLSRRELFVSGLRVGRAVIGTMTTTLLFAYSSTYTMAMMWFMIQEVPLAVFLNSPFMSAEMLNTLAGSLGLVTVAPLTALAGAVLYSSDRRSQ